MQIMIMRTLIFDQKVLPVLKQQAAMAKLSLEDYIRDLLYKSFHYKPIRRSMAQVQGDRIAEQATAKQAKIPSIVVAVDAKFYQQHNINYHMKTVNKILYEAAGVGQLYR